MGCPVPVHCRYCREPLDVYEPLESRFCVEECEAAFTAENDPNYEPPELGDAWAGGFAPNH
jgi:hypothetical protein